MVDRRIAPDQKESKWLGIPICAVSPLVIMISGCIGASILSRLSGPRKVQRKNNV